MIDGDIYGPNVPMMLGLSAELGTNGSKIIPAERYGLQVVSMAFLTPDDAPVIWRGPMLHGAIQQFFREVAWQDVDYLVIDMPPGTGDVALSLGQTVPVAGAVVVTTPQQVSLADSARAVAMYKKLHIPTLGIIDEPHRLREQASGRRGDPLPGSVVETTARHPRVDGRLERSLLHVHVMRDPDAEEVRDVGGVQAEDVAMHNFPCSAEFTLPPLSVTVFVATGTSETTEAVPVSAGQAACSSHNLIEAVRQLMGEGGKRQIKNTKNALNTGIGWINYGRNWGTSAALVLVPGE